MKRCIPLHTLKALHLGAALTLMISLSNPVAQAANAQQPITQGIAEIEISYEDMGPMAAMLPKTERLYFRPGQTRTESGINVSLKGVLEGQTAQLMELEGHKVAFLIPNHPESSADDSGLRFEATRKTRTIAGFQAQQIDAVDREDETNRLPFWMTDEVRVDQIVQPGLPIGFTLDYTLMMNEGSSHKVVTRVEAKTLSDDLFQIPEDYRQISVGSATDISKHLGEILGGNVKVMD